jgi:hypothetical protein
MAPVANWPGNFSAAPTNQLQDTQVVMARPRPVTKRRSTGLPAIAALLAATAPVTAQVAARPAVVELYTSQGCSSCPPADALLGELARRPQVLALAFHVDYWDDLGWHDRFDLPAAAQRQSQYARHLALSSVYTPQMIIDGRSDVLGSDRQRVAQLLSAPRMGVPVHIVMQGDDLAVKVDAAAGAPACAVVLVAYLSEASTAIGRGENAGRTLREFNIVRSFATLGAWQGDAAEWHVKLRSLPADASHVAALLQQPGPGAIVGAASARLP